MPICNWTKALCKLCHKTIALSNMGKQALASHVTSKKHVDNSQDKYSAALSPSVKSLFGIKKLSTCTVTTASVSSHEVNYTEGGEKSLEEINADDINLDEDVRDLYIPPPADALLRDDVPPGPAIDPPVLQPVPQLDRWLQSKATRKAEILWAIKCVQSHHSFRTNEDISKLLKVMFYDSHIAANYECGRTKQGYLITFGLAPYFRDILVRDIRNCDSYTVIFDEAFNSTMQKDQMDILVRFWKADQVSKRYFASELLGSGKAEDLLGALK